MRSSSLLLFIRDGVIMKPAVVIVENDNISPHLSQNRQERTPDSSPYNIAEDIHGGFQQLKKMLNVEHGMMHMGSPSGRLLELTIPSTLKTIVTIWFRNRDVSRSSALKE